MTGSSVWRRLLLLALIATFFSGCSRDPNVRKNKYFQSGQRYFQKGKYREASIQFANALQVDSRFVDAHYKLAQSYMKLQNWNQAYEELDRTVQLDPDHTDAQLDMANLLLLSNDYKSAQEHVDTVLGKNPNNATAHEVAANLKARQNGSSRGSAGNAESHSTRPQSLGHLPEPRHLTDAGQSARRRRG